MSCPRSNNYPFADARSSSCRTVRVSVYRFSSVRSSFIWFSIIAIGSVFVIPHQVGAVFLHGLHKAVCIIRLHKTGDYSIQCFSGKALNSSSSIKALSTPCDDSYYQSYASYSHSQLNNALLCYLAHTDPLQSMPHDHH